MHINSAAYTSIAFLNWWVFVVIFSSTQLSQDFNVSNGGPISKKIPVKIYRWKTWVSQCLANIVLKSKENNELFLLVVVALEENNLKIWYIFEDVYWQDIVKSALESASFLIYFWSEEIEGG